MNITKKLWIAIIILVLLTPLGLISDGTAWGEWAPEEFSTLVGYIPTGLERGSESWTPLLTGYNIPGLDGSYILSSLSYLFSAVIGAGIIVTFVFFMGRFLSKENGDELNDNT